MKIRAMTFNIQHTIDYRRGTMSPELMANTIRAFDPDFCVLNEVYGHRDGAEPVFDEQTALLAELARMDHFFFCPAVEICGSPYGNAILSRFPFSGEKIAIPDPDPRLSDSDWYETRCVLKADFGPFAVLGTHFGLAPDEQVSAVETVLAQLARRDKPLIFCGDLNMTPENPTLAPIFAALRDTAAVMSAPKLSFPSDEPRKKIDYIFVSDEFRVLSADIPAVVASDHRPHLAELEL